MTLTHHELCFGCGQANLFGLQMELEDAGGEAVNGRFFLKQDHQGPPGAGHAGVIAAALEEAMAMVLRREGGPPVIERLEVAFEAPAPVGTFVRLEARVERREGDRAWVSAEATGPADDRTGTDGKRGEVAGARAVFRRGHEEPPR